MPELPEIEKVKKDLYPYIIEKTIIKVKAVNDTIVYQKQDINKIIKSILGKKVLEIRRHGKIFWIELEDSCQLGFKCGTTTEIEVKKKKLIEFKGKNQDFSWLPREIKIKIFFTKDKELIKNIDKWNSSKNNEEEEKKIINTLENNEKVEYFYYSEVGHFSRIMFSKNILKQYSNYFQGFDALNELPSYEEFLKVIKTKNCGIKSLLVDQTFIAGIGNWVS